MVNLTRIYTRTGDDGTTALGDMSRTGKNDPRLVAYAESTRPTARSVSPSRSAGCPTTSARCWRLQNDLFDVGADLCTPVDRRPEYPPLRVTRTTSTGSRRECDEHNAGLDEAALVRAARRARRARRCCTWRAPSYAAPSAPPGRRSAEHADVA